MHLSDVMEMKDDPSFREAEPAWSIDCELCSSEDDETSHELVDEEGHPESTEDILEKLIDSSLEKIHKLQTAHQKDERKRVLVVNMLHSLLLNKMDFLQKELVWEGHMDIEESEPSISKQEAASLLNKILQEKIGFLGYNRTVKIWVEPPNKPGQNARISVPQKGQKRTVKKDEKVHEEKHEENSAAPSEREPNVKL